MCPCRYTLAGMILLASASVLSAQTPGGDRAPPPWMGAFDPTRIFESMDRNRDGVVTRDELSSRRDLERFDEYIRRAGVTDGRLTGELFLKAFQQRMEERLSGRLGDRTRRAPDPEVLFRNYDRNNDGRLDADEVQRTPRLRNEADHWDRNGDGSLSPEEFTAYMQAVGQPGQMVGQAFGSRDAVGQPGSAGSLPEGLAGEARPDEPRPQYRAGKLPPNLPEWFAQLDRDGDGQVGLYEWTDRPMEEYLELDRNADGFITIEEAEHAASKAAKPPVEASPLRSSGER